MFPEDIIYKTRCYPQTYLQILLLFTQMLQLFLLLLTSAAPIIKLEQMLQHLIRYYLNLHVSHTPSGITYRHVTVTFLRPCPQKYVLLSPTQVLSITKTKVLPNFHFDITYTSFHIIFAPSVSIH